MTVKRKKRLAAVLALLLLFLTACGTRVEFDPITDIMDLGGRSVGVGLAYGADYVLTPRDGKDLKLYRYDSAADALMALRFRKIDAIAADSLDVKLMLHNTEGLAVWEEPIEDDSYLVYVTPKREDLCATLNEFLASYKQTEAYAEFLQRINEYDGTNYTLDEPIQLTGTGEKIRVGFMVEAFPISFTTPEGEPQGFMLELLENFFNAKNYDVELIPTGEADLYMGIENGSYDMVIGYISNAYRTEALVAGLHPSDPCIPNPIYLVYMEDQDEVSISEEYITQ